MASGFLIEGLLILVLILLMVVVVVVVLMIQMIQMIRHYLKNYYKLGYSH